MRTYHNYPLQWTPHFHRFLLELESIENDTGILCMHCLRPIWKQHDTVTIGKSTYHLSCFSWRVIEKINYTPPVKSDIWGRCRSCDGLTEFGICIKCGFGVICSRCGRVKYPDGAWRISQKPTVISHGFCKPCIRILYGDQADLIIARIDAHEEEAAHA